MKKNLRHAADGFERAQSIDALWNSLSDALSREGFNHCFKLSASTAGNGVEVVAGDLQDENQRNMCRVLLSWVCSSYAPRLIGQSFVDLYPDMPPSVWQLFSSNTGFDWRAGICIPTRLFGNDDHSAYLFGSSQEDVDLEQSLMVNMDGFHTLCLLFDRHLQYLTTGFREEAHAGHDASCFEALSLREQAVAELLGQGHRRNAIAEELGIRTNTVSSHIKSLYRKLGVHSQVEVMRLYNDQAKHYGDQEHNPNGASIQP